MENFASQGASVDLSLRDIKASNYTYTTVKNDRTAGFLPSYTKDGSFKTALSSFDGQKQHETTVFVSKEEHFGFFDLIDMINPLQHIPLLNLAYRKITGDSIKPISQIIGGTVFGGPAGAASGLVTAAIEDGTGKSPIDNALSLARGDRNNMQAYNDLPPELLSFAEIPSVKDQNYNYNV